MVASVMPLDWRSEATSGNWNDSNNLWDGGPTAPHGTGILRFGSNQMENEPPGVLIMTTPLMKQALARSIPSNPVMMTHLRVSVIE